MAATKRHLPGSGFNQSSNHPQQGGFTTPGWPQDAYELAALHFKIKPTDNLQELTPGNLILDIQAANNQERINLRHGHRHPLREELTGISLGHIQISLYQPHLLQNREHVFPGVCVDRTKFISIPEVNRPGQNLFLNLFVR